MRVKEESERADLKLTIQKLKITVLGPIMSRQTKGGKWKRWQTRQRSRMPALISGLLHKPLGTFQGLFHGSGPQRACGKMQSPTGDVPSPRRMGLHDHHRSDLTLRRMQKTCSTLKTHQEWSSQKSVHLSQGSFLWQLPQVTALKWRKKTYPREQPGRLPGLEAPRSN